MRSQRISALRVVAVVSLLLVAGLVAAPAALAFDARGGDTVLVRAGEIVDDDLYAFGTNVTIDGSVRGDVVFAGNALTLNGTVDGNVIGAGQSLIINGVIRDSARLAGQAVVLGSRAKIGRDVLFGGYSLEQRTGSIVGRDLVAGGYQALLAGSVGRNVSAGVEALELTGAVGGNVQAEVGDAVAAPGPRPFFMPMPQGVSIPYVAPGLKMSENARIDGRLSYTARSALPIEGQVGGGTAYTPRAGEEPATPPVGSAFADHARRFGAIAIIGVLLIWLAPSWTRRIADTMRERPLPAMGWGFVAAASFFGAAVLGVLSTIISAVALGAATLGSLVGLVIVVGLLAEAVLVSGFVIYTGFVAQAAVSYVSGRWLVGLVRPNLAEQRVIPLLLGSLIFVTITAIAVLGPIVGFLAAVLALGAGWMWAVDRFRPAPAMTLVAPIEENAQAA